MTDDDKRQLAERAKEILEDPIISAAFARMERDAFEAFLALEPSQNDERLARQMELKAIRELQSMLATIVGAGKITEHKPVGIV